MHVLNSEAVQCLLKNKLLDLWCSSRACSTSIALLKLQVQEQEEQQLILRGGLTGLKGVGVGIFEHLTR